MKRTTMLRVVMPIVMMLLLSLSVSLSWVFAQDSKSLNWVAALWTLLASALLAYFGVVLYKNIRLQRRINRRLDEVVQQKPRRRRARILDF
jgi:uncharacterized membrane protein YfcA